MCECQGQKLLVEFHLDAQGPGPTRRSGSMLWVHTYTWWDSFE